MANKRPPRYIWKRKTIGEEWTPKGRVSQEELLNRVILAKALMAYASGQTMHFRTRNEEYEITPAVAKDVMRVAGRLPQSRKPASSGSKQK